MSKTIICTTEMLEQHLKNTVSERRYIHSFGVAQTTKMLLEKYGCQACPNEWNGFSAPIFCGLAHDLARELSDSSILQYCEKNGLTLTKGEIVSPVLAHGLVSAHMAKELCGDYPASWERAIIVHTVGNSNMDDLALALFSADFIEPSRRFMTEERRSYYLSAPNLASCAYRILCDMLDHWKKSGSFEPSEEAKLMKAELEAKGCAEGRFPWAEDWRK
jgi:HD superfamily phosphohydrolase YqeK